MGWSPNGRYIASGGVDTTVQVWDATNGTLIYKYTGHSAEVESVSWSPDSKRVASAGDDKSVQVWQVA
jgi:WD40 repeat protein